MKKHDKIIFRFIKDFFIGLLSVCTTRKFGGSLASNYKGPIKCVFLNKQSCQIRPTLVNTIDDPYARVCVLNKVKK